MIVYTKSISINYVRFTATQDTDIKNWFIDYRIYSEQRDHLLLANIEARKELDLSAPSIYVFLDWGSYCAHAVEDIPGGAVRYDQSSPKTQMNRLE